MRSNAIIQLQGIAFLLIMILMSPLFLLLAIYLAIYRKLSPADRVKRDWYPSNALCAQPHIRGRELIIRQMRDMSLEQWQNRKTLKIPEGEPSPFHTDRSYQIDNLKDVWLCYSPTHVWLTFEFEDKPQSQDKHSNSMSYLTLSVEARLDYQGSGKLSLFRAIFPCVTLYTSLSTEEDLLNRCMIKKDWPYPIWMYPIRDRKAGSDPYLRNLVHQVALARMIRRVQDVSERPEYYSYFDNSCAINLMDIGNAGIRAVTPHHTRKHLWKRGVLSYLQFSELGMQRLMYESELVDLERLGLHANSSFEEVSTRCRVDQTLIKLYEEGVRGDKLAVALREDLIKHH